MLLQLVDVGNTYIDEIVRRWRRSKITHSIKMIEYKLNNGNTEMRVRVAMIKIEFVGCLFCCLLLPYLVHFEEKPVSTLVSIIDINNH